MSSLTFYVLHYGSQYFSGLNKKENAPKKGVFILIFVVVIFNYVINNYIL